MNRANWTPSLPTINQQQQTVTGNKRKRQKTPEQTNMQPQNTTKKPKTQKPKTQTQTRNTMQLQTTFQN